MKNNRLRILAVLLVISLVNLSRRDVIETIRAVDFLSIFVVGMLTGAVVLALADKFKNKEQQ